MNSLCTESDIVEALRFIESECSRDEWAKIGMSIKAELGDAGFTLFDEWSAQASSYDKRACKATWKSIKASGSGSSIGIGSLFAKAKAGGWTPSKKELSPAEQAELERQRAIRSAKRKAEEEAEQALAGRWRQVFAEFWNDNWDVLLAPFGASPYLANKQCEPHGLGFPRERFVLLIDCEQVTVTAITEHQAINEFFADERYKDREKYSFRHIKRGCVLVPMRDTDGRIYNTQIIYPTGRKSFPRNAPKKGLFHRIGKAVPGGFYGIAEGYATAETVHKATGCPIYVAFDVGGLRPVVQKIRSAAPQASLVVFADNDAQTEGNPGLSTARDVAHEFGCRWVAPRFDSKGDV